MSLDAEDAEHDVYSCNDPAQRQEGFAEAKMALGRSGSS